MQTIKPNHPVVVFGATGVQGGAVAQILANAGYPVRALGRDQAKLSRLADNRVEPYYLSAFTENEIDAALEGMWGAFVCLPLASGFREQEILNASRLCCRCLQRSSVQRIVWTASWLTTQSNSNVSPFFDALRDATDLALSLLPSTVVFSPAGYLDNLLTPDARASIRQGHLRYMLPEQMLYRWISSKDQARLVSALLSVPSVESRRYAIGQTATGSDLAQAASCGLGYTVIYETVRPEDFANAWRSTIGAVADLVAQDYMDIAAHSAQFGVNDNLSEVATQFNFAYQPISEWFSDHAKMYQSEIAT